MKYRTALLLLFLIPAFSIGALTLYNLRIHADQHGKDAVDYVILHGSVTHENSVSQVRPTDVTGVYINEGYANKTMIDLLRYLPNLRSIVIGPDLSSIPVGTPADQLPKPSIAVASDVRKMRAAFPDLDVHTWSPKQVDR